MQNQTWSKSSWRKFPISQSPNWPDPNEANRVKEELSHLPALVFAGETRRLQQLIAEAGAGKAFILQAGDCAEEFSRCNGPSIHNFVRVILQMAVILAYSTGKRIVNVGRIAGQYAKPRSSEYETINGVQLPIYRGDMVNSNAAQLDARRPDPTRMIEGYFRSAATLNLVRAFMHGGYAELDFVKAWHHDFDQYFPINPEYELLSQEIRKAISFIHAIEEKDSMTHSALSEIYTSHEALLLDYEEAMTRIDTTTGLWYDTSAHFLWVGERTRQADQAHIEFLSGINNPIGIKIGPDYQIDEIIDVIEKLNPENLPGKITLISRFGSQLVTLKLPELIRVVKEKSLSVTWLCDPMHGNTTLHPSGRKTRNLRDILHEIEQNLTIHKQLGTILGGIHLEITGEHVTECISDAHNQNNVDSLDNFQSTCDPRLNVVQSVDLAFKLAKMLERKL